MEGELAYIDLINGLIAKYDAGIPPRCNRTGEGTVSEFGKMFKYDLTGGQLPLFRCKYVHFKSVLVELMWFLRGRLQQRF